MEDLGKYTRRTELYKLSAEEQTEKMKMVMKEVEKISAYTGVSEEAAYNLFLNGYDVPSELDGQKIAFSESELTIKLARFARKLLISVCLAWYFSRETLSNSVLSFV